jgi:GAF domain-containing protein
MAKKEYVSIEFHSIDEQENQYKKIYIESKFYYVLMIHGIKIAIPSLFFGVFLTTGAPWWLKIITPSNFSISIEIWQLALGLILMIISGLSWVAFVYNRSQKKHFELTKLYHEIIHYVRDEYSKPTVGSDPEDINLARISAILCEKVKNYFGILKRSDILGAAIRVVIDQGDGVLGFKTIGRANLSQPRAASSENLPFNRGVSMQFQRHHCQGVLIYNDIEKAIKEGVFHETKNEKNDVLKKEIQSLIVAPLTIYGENAIIGLLYVTSRQTNYFSSRDVNHIEGLADIVSIAIRHMAKKIEKSPLGGKSGKVY